MSNNADKLRQRLEIRKYLVFAGMFLLFLGAMWFIFAPSEEDRRKEEKMRASTPNCLTRGKPA